MRARVPILVRCRAFLPDKVIDDGVGGKLDGSKGYSFYAGGGFDDYLVDGNEHKGGAGFDEYMSRGEEFENAKGEGNLVLLDKNGAKIAGKPPRTAKGSIVWSLIVSLDGEATKENSLTSIAPAVVKETFKRLMRANGRHGFEGGHFECAAVVHTNTLHHHVHFRLYQPENVGGEHLVKRYKLAPSGFESVKAGVSLLLVGGRAGDTEVNEAALQLRREFATSLRLTLGGTKAEAEIAAMIVSGCGTAVALSRKAKSELSKGGGNAGRVTFSYLKGGDPRESGELARLRCQLLATVEKITSGALASNEGLLNAWQRHQGALIRQSGRISSETGIARSSEYAKNALRSRQEEVKAQLGNEVLALLADMNASWRSRKTRRVSFASASLVKASALKAEQRAVLRDWEAVIEDEVGLRRMLKRKD